MARHQQIEAQGISRDVLCQVARQHHADIANARLAISIERRRIGLKPKEHPRPMPESIAELGDGLEVKKYQMARAMLEALARPLEGLHLDDLFWFTRSTPKVTTVSAACSKELRRRDRGYVPSDFDNSVTAWCRKRLHGPADQYQPRLGYGDGCRMDPGIEVSTAHVGDTMHAHA